MGPEIVPAFVEIMEFFQVRLRGVFLSGGAGYDSVEAVLQAGFDDPSDARRRLGALSRFRSREDFERLAVAFRRAANILEGKVPAEVRPDRLQEEAEKELYSVVQQLGDQLDPFFSTREYDEIMNRMLVLKDPVDRFFDEVLVMCEDQEVRENRLALLAGIARIFHRIADFSKLVIT